MDQGRAPAQIRPIRAKNNSGFLWIIEVWILTYWLWRTKTEGCSCHCATTRGVHLRRRGELRVNMGIKIKPWWHWWSLDYAKTESMKLDYSYSEIWCNKSQAYYPFLIKLFLFQVAENSTQASLSKMGIYCIISQNMNNLTSYFQSWHNQDSINVTRV